jgi:hypothetical protein
MGTMAQALVSLKKYMPPPLPYFVVSICPLPLPHFASIFSLICDPFADGTIICILKVYFTFERR